LRGWDRRRPAKRAEERIAQRKTARKLAFPSCVSRTEILVRLAGIEPTTPWFVAKYSIQLSYSREALHYSMDGRLRLEIVMLFCDAAASPILRASPEHSNIMTRHLARRTAFALASLAIAAFAQAALAAPNSGLTPKQARKLRAEQDKIHAVERKAASHGGATPREQRKLQKMRAKESRDAAKYRQRNQ
jgi:hypothetical protein